MSKKLEDKPIILDKISLSPNGYQSLEIILKEYLSKITVEYPLIAVLGIPGPVMNNSIIEMPNIPHWGKETGENLAIKLGMKKVLLLNDFVCNGYGIQTELKLNEDFIILNDVPRQKDGPILIIGPGTGLGVSFLLKNKGQKYYTIGSSEGGRKDFTPINEKYFQIRQFLKRELGNNNISIGAICSGRALIPLYRYILETENIQRDMDLGKKIDEFHYGDKILQNKLNIEMVNKGLTGQCELSKKVLLLFIEIFGEIVGDISLFSLPTNGIYLLGGISAAIEPLIKNNTIFMDHFIDKKGYENIVKSFPVYLIKKDDIGMVGAAEAGRRILEKEGY